VWSRCVCAALGSTAGGRVCRVGVASAQPATAESVREGTPHIRPRGASAVYLRNLWRTRTLRRYARTARARCTGFYSATGGGGIGNDVGLEDARWILSSYISNTTSALFQPCSRARDGPRVHLCSTSAIAFRGRVNGRRRTAIAKVDNASGVSPSREGGEYQEEYGRP
jgi:hypothetical protein